MKRSTKQRKRKYNMKRILIIILVILLVVSGGIIAYKTWNSKFKQAQPGSKETAGKALESDDFRYEAQVTIGKNGFEPSTITVKTGTRVFWVNSDNIKHTLILDPGSDEELHFGNKVIEAGSGYGHSFFRAAHFSYHDGNNPSHTGKLYVKEED